MKVRGRRECQSCGAVWSYYETGSPACPDCGSLHSVGLDERTRHTDAPATLELVAVTSALPDLSRAELAERAATAARSYVRKRGFIDAGCLRALDWTYVAARVLAAVGAAHGRRGHPAEAEELYVLTLLRNAEAADRETVDPEDVPASLAPAYALALAAAVGDYLADVRTYLADNPDPAARRLAGRIRDHRKRIEALDGEVDPAEAHRLLCATRDVGTYLRRGEDSALVTADNWLAGLAPSP